MRDNDLAAAAATIATYQSMAGAVDDGQYWRRKWMHRISDMMSQLVWLPMQAMLLWQVVSSAGQELSMQGVTDHAR